MSPIDILYFDWFIAKDPTVFFKISRRELENMMKWECIDVNGTTPTIKNHTITYARGKLLVFGGFDGRRNHNSIHIFDCHDNTWELANDVRGQIPPGRNGHTATLVHHQLFIIGGWLGDGPLAAKDMYILDVDRMNWTEPEVIGTPPGPCNMHTATYIPTCREIFVFRGGDGCAYLNDLHALHTDLLRWRVVSATGSVPSPRANHGATLWQSTLFVFGGWDGTKRLNDIHLLDIENLVWTTANVVGNLPHPRAGMTFMTSRDRLYCFGGSSPGQSSKQFEDLQIFDPADMKWLDVVQLSEVDEPHDEASATDLYLDHLANPNDHSPTKNSIIRVSGTSPSRRAGHTCTLVHRTLYVFGGSFGNEYLNDLFALDTDPMPQVRVSQTSSIEQLRASLHSFVNSNELSDISFLVEGQVVYGHRLILALQSDRFRGMFSSNFRESTQSQITVEGVSHHAFVQMLDFLYTGKLLSLEKVVDNFTISDVEVVVDLLHAADQYLIDHLKERCEKVLQQMIRHDTVEYIHHTSASCNAFQLDAICRHFKRNHTSR